MHAGDFTRSASAGSTSSALQAASSISNAKPSAACWSDLAPAKTWPLYAPLVAMPISAAAVKVRPVRVFAFFMATSEFGAAITMSVKRLETTNRRSWATGHLWIAVSGLATPDMRRDDRRMRDTTMHENEHREAFDRIGEDARAVGDSALRVGAAVDGFGDSVRAAEPLLCALAGERGLIDPEEETREAIEALGTSPPPTPGPRSPGSQQNDVKALPLGSIAIDCNGDKLVVWPDGSYGRPDGPRIPATIASSTFAPYTIVEVGLTAEQCSAVR